MTYFVESLATAVGYGGATFPYAVKLNDGSDGGAGTIVFLARDQDQAQAVADILTARE